MLHPIGKQAYKLELPQKWRIHNFFHVSMLEQDFTKKGQMNDMQLDFEFKVYDNKSMSLMASGTARSMPRSQQQSNY